jgi:hypothetical protein
MIRDDIFDNFTPTMEQADRMHQLRNAAKNYMEEILHLVPEGNDKKVAILKLRECAMWANVAVTRNEDGSPRRE